MPLLEFAHPLPSLRLLANKHTRAIITGEEPGTPH